ncbi:DUF1906 domain-containing protein [Phytohabitans kaempferiae]|uniref:DUF1906 domain-containing protein n=1 Tax=Phytohabitans kaempferiae TaxID=1620943 RepID=A0ABV6MFX6_9ACTN
MRKALLGAATVALAGGIAVAVIPTASARPAPTKTVTYRGYAVTVPAAWPVVDLAKQPRACVRFDRNAVYLGRPGARQDCPARLVGTTDALLIEPLDAVSARSAGGPVLRVPAGHRSPAKLSSTVDHRVAVAVEGAGVLVTATYRTAPTAVEGILRGARVRPGAKAATLAGVARGPGTFAAAPVEVPGDFTGLGFDACTAPSSAAMDAWLSSPYRAIGVYIGGVSRGCAQPNLTAEWVARQAANGWHIFPIYVGLQAPCTTYRNRIDPAQATAQGRAAGDDAASKAAALGLARESVIIADIEYYPRGGTCSQAVLEFLSGWTRALHAQGYRSSVYSSVSAAIADLVDNYNNTAYARPDYIDFARWDGVATVEDAAIPASFWMPGRRIKQYRGDHVETHGGVAINIDSNQLDVTRHRMVTCFSGQCSQPPRTPWRR